MTRIIVADRASSSRMMRIIVGVSRIIVGLLPRHRQAPAKPDRKMFHVKHRPAGAPSAMPRMAPSRLTPGRTAGGIANQPLCTGLIHRSGVKSASRTSNRVPAPADERDPDQAFRHRAHLEPGDDPAG